MIYHIYWSGVAEHRLVPLVPAGFEQHPFYADQMGYAHLHGKYINPRQLLAEVIKETEDCSFVFILTTVQLPEFRQWLIKNDLNDCVVYEMPQPITNGYHPENGRNLTLFTLCSPKHFWRDMYED